MKYLIAIALSLAAFPANADSLWDHNGSIMRLLADGNQRAFVYEVPRTGMRAAGAGSGDIVFRGQVVGSQYVGTAFIFSRDCGPTPYRVAGPIVTGSTRVVMQGMAPRVGPDCQVYSTFLDTLEFSYIRQAH
jgi:hypothetical protein